MNVDVNGDPRWTQRTWVLAALGGFAAQVLGVYLLSMRSPASVVPALAEPRVAMVTGQENNHFLVDRLVVSDPTLLALVGAHGFSASPWLNYGPPEHQPPEWSEPEQWLSQSPSLLGRTFSQFVRTNAASPPMMTTKPVPQVARISVPPQTMATQSVLRIEGDVLPGPQMIHPRLPVWPHTNTVADTVVQVTVDAAGYTHSAVVFSSGGPRDSVQLAADQYALAWAKTNRFQPAAGVAGKAGWRYGTLTFEWVSPAVTNKSGTAD